MIRKIFNIALILSLALNILLGFWLVMSKVEENTINQQLQAQQVNGKVVNFTKLFVQKVLEGQSEISFEDRLQLENAVRDLDDQAIFTQWQKFTKSQSDADAQQTVGILFNLLLDKISY